MESLSKVWNMGAYNSREIIELEKNLLFQTRTAFFEI